jgi:shikimate dehydrogenase
VLEPDPSEYELIVNSTAVGLRGEDVFVELPLDREGFAPGQVVIDMVYGAEPSALLRAATANGATVVGGVEILVHQGGLSFEIWTGREAPLDTMRSAARL